MDLFNTLVNFWNAVPGELVQLIATFIGATCRGALTKKKFSVVQGFGSSIASFIFSYAITSAITFLWKQQGKEVWFVGFLVAFFVSYILLALDRTAEQLSDDPVGKLGGFVERQADKITDKWLDKFNTTQDEETQRDDENEPHMP